MASQSTLPRKEVRALYDRIGRWQDTQVFYEKPAIDALLRRGDFHDVQKVFEVGCGTGRVAERVLRDHCPPDTTYVGVDVSPTMVRIARGRLNSFGARAQVRRSDGGFAFQESSASQDRILATYLLDLLSRDDIQLFLEEAHRLLHSSGRLCLAGLTWGEDPLSRLISRLWSLIQSVWPRAVGGCRPVRATAFLDTDRWYVRHHEVVRAWGIPSEVVVATPR